MIGLVLAVVIIVLMLAAHFGGLLLIVALATVVLGATIHFGGLYLIHREEKRRDKIGGSW